MTEVLLDQETNPAATTRWLQKMSGPVPIKGHAMRKERDGYWCHCGHYCGGLEALDAWVYRNGGLDITTWAHRRHGLHLIQIIGVGIVRTNALNYYLVMCEHPDHPPHAYIIEADSVATALAIGRYRYVLTVDLTTSEQVTAQATPYRALPEIMFSGRED